jgi:hypothetical protein
MLSISQRMQPQSKVSEERESSRMSNEPLKVPRETPQSCGWSINTPTTRNKPLCQKRVPHGLSAMTSWTVRDDLMDCPCLNSSVKNAKSTAVRVACWAGRTVRQDPADYPLGPRGLSAGSPQIVRPVHPSCESFSMIRG